MTDTGLTPFIVAMIKAPIASLARADVRKLAAKYCVRTDHAQFYITEWIKRGEAA